MITARRIVIVGGGPAGVGAALAARAQDAAAEIVLVVARESVPAADSETEPPSPVGDRGPPVRPAVEVFES